MKIAHRFGVVLMVALASLFLSPGLRAQEVRNSTPTPAAGAETHKDADKDKETPIPPEKAVATDAGVELQLTLLRCAGHLGSAAGANHPVPVHPLGFEIFFECPGLGYPTFQLRQQR